MLDDNILSFDRNPASAVFCFSTERHLALVGTTVSSLWSVQTLLIFTLLPISDLMAGLVSQHTRLRHKYYYQKKKVKPGRDSDVGLQCFK